MRLALLAAVVLPIALLAEGAQSTTIRLGDGSAQAGARVVVPLSLQTTEGVAVDAIETRLTYPRSALTFVKVQPSGLSVGVGAKLDSRVENGPDAKSATLRVTVSSASAATPLPRGPLAYIEFTIDKAAKPNTTIDLVPQVTAFLSAQKQVPADSVSIGKGKITVAAPPVPGCFFYMH